MVRRSSNRLSSEIIAGLVLLAIGLSALGADFFPAILLVLLGGYFLWRQFETAPRAASRDDGYAADYDDHDYADQRPSGAEQVYAHALQAAERAGLDPSQAPVIPVDIGVMAFRGDQTPGVFRTRPVPDDVDYIQPFVQVRLPTRARGRIKFEILDSNGQRLFVHEDFYQLEHGRNLITPTARLPIHDAQAMHRDWRLRVTADGLPLAEHAFRWQDTDLSVVRRHLTEDGEISTELRTALSESRLGELSLDELLADQETPDAERRRQR